MPLIVISPYARHNYVDHNISSQSSVLNLIEYNWRLPSIDGSADALLTSADRSERVPFDLAGLFRFRHDWFGEQNSKLFLNPVTGQPVGHGRHDRRRHRHR